MSIKLMGSIAFHFQATITGQDGTRSASKMFDNWLMRLALKFAGWTTAYAADARQLSEVRVGESLHFKFMMGSGGMFTVFGFSVGPLERVIATLDPEDTKRLAQAMADAYRVKQGLQ